MRPQPIRTLHVEAAEDGTSGGSHRSLYDLVIGLSPAGFAPTVVFYEDNPFVLPLQEAGADVHIWDDIRKQERKVLGNTPKIFRFGPVARHIFRRIGFIRKHSIELVHLNNSPYVGYTDWLPAAMIRNISCLASMRGDATINPNPRQLAAFRRYSRIIPVSHYVAQSPTCMALEEDRVTVVVDGVDLERLRTAELSATEARQLRSALGVLPRHEVLAVMAGTIREWKGQLRVAEAVTYLPTEDARRLRLVFAGGWGPGDEPYVTKIRSLISREGLGETVELLGHRDDIPQLFSAADVAIHASTTEEPFGLVVVEALAMGTPVLAARGGGPSGILQQGGGLLHEPTRPRELAGHLSSMINSPVLRLRLSEEASVVAESYSIQRTREAMACVFRSLTHKRSIQ